MCKMLLTGDFNDRIRFNFDYFYNDVHFNTLRISSIIYAVINRLPRVINVCKKKSQIMLNTLILRLTNNIPSPRNKWSVEANFIKEGDIELENCTIPVL